MRTAITIGIHPGGEIVELLDAAPTSVDEQRRRFKEARAAAEHERFESIELWDSSGGRVLRHRFKGKLPSAQASQPESDPVPPPAEVPVSGGGEPVPEEPAQPAAPVTAEAEDAAPAADASGDEGEEFEVSKSAKRRRKQG